MEVVEWGGVEMSRINIRLCKRTPQTLSVDRSTHYPYGTIAASMGEIAAWVELESAILEVCMLSRLTYHQVCDIVGAIAYTGPQAIDIAHAIRHAALEGQAVTQWGEETLKWIQKNDGKQTYPML